MLRMQYFGYDMTLRYENLKSAYNAYDTIKDKEINEGVPMYRNKEYRRNERRKEKVTKMKNCYKKGKYKTVMFIPATPNSILRKEVQSYIDRSGIKIKVAERAGTKVVRLLQKNDPFKPRECVNDNCMICKTCKSGNCRSLGVINEISFEG